MLLGVRASLSMKVMSPGPASSTGRAERMATLPVADDAAADQRGELLHRGDHAISFLP